MSNLKYLQDPALGLVPAARPLQVGLGAYLEQALLTKTPVLCEAGTGCGKSYAYLLPAFELAKSGTRVVIATAMCSLQRQLFEKDLPTVKACLGSTVEFARVLGKANYLCKRQVHLNVFQRGDLAAYEEFFESTPYWITDDAPEDLLSRMPKDRYQHSVAYCNGAKCDYYVECSETGYLAAKNEAATAKIVIANHALVGADMRVWAQHEKKMLGDYRALIVDEAHKFPEAIRSALACEMPGRFFEQASAKYHDIALGIDSDLNALMLDEATRRIPRDLPMLRQLDSQYTAMFRETNRKGTYGPEAFAFATYARQSIEELKHACDVGTPEFQNFLVDSDYGKPTKKLTAELRDCEPAMRALYYLDEYVNKLTTFANAIDLATTDSLRYVVDVETDQKGNTVIKTIPIHIGERIIRYNEERVVVPAYLSATLTVHKEFDYFAREVGHDAWTQMPPHDGTPRPKPTFIAGSPFDPKNAWCYVPQGLPEPNQDGYIQAVATEAYDLLMANEGHAFILFTSYKDMEAMAHELRMKHYPYPLLIQSERLKARGREMFMNTPHATLLGTRSFWEGIDIPGLQLSLVIIPKAPFPNPGDAIVKAKSKIAGDKWFHQVSMPMMLIDLRQMAGRLIRTTSDKGIVALLDGRVHSKNYGRQMVEAVGPNWGTSKVTATKLLTQLSNIRKKSK